MKQHPKPTAGVPPREMSTKPTSEQAGMTGRGKWALLPPRRLARSTAMPTSSLSHPSITSAHRRHAIHPLRSSSSPQCTLVNVSLPIRRAAAGAPPPPALSSHTFRPLCRPAFDTSSARTTSSPPRQSTDHHCSRETIICAHHATLKRCIGTSWTDRCRGPPRGGGGAVH